jgi:opacity protein-like surface antigen
MVLQESHLALSQLGSRFSSFRVLEMTACLLVIVLVRPALTQTVAPQPTQKKFTPHIDFSLGVFGQLTPARTPTTSTTELVGIESTQTTQGSSPSAGVLGVFHQSIKQWLGYNVNLGYSRFSENYSRDQAFVPNPTTTFPPFSRFSQGSIGTNMYETTVAYSVQGPQTKQFSTFAQVGGGGLWFLPTQSPSPYHEQVRATMVFGIGLNYKLTEGLGLRAEYRGLFYKNPDFADLSASTVPISRLFTVTNEPTVSVVYTFGGSKKKNAKAH